MHPNTHTPICTPTPINLYAPQHPYTYAPQHPYTYAPQHPYTRPHITLSIISFSIILTHFNHSSSHLLLNLTYSSQDNQSLPLSHLSNGALPSWVDRGTSRSVWPDLAKFRRFGTTLKHFGHFVKCSFSIRQNFELILVHFFIGPILIDVNGQILNI